MLNSSKFCDVSVICLHTDDQTVLVKTIQFSITQQTYMVPSIAMYP